MRIRNKESKKRKRKKKLNVFRNDYDCIIMISLGGKRICNWFTNGNAKAILTWSEGVFGCVATMKVVMVGEGSGVGKYSCCSRCHKHAAVLQTKIRTVDSERTPFSESERVFVFCHFVCPNIRFEARALIIFTDSGVVCPDDKNLLKRSTWGHFNLGVTATIHYSDMPPVPLTNALRVCHCWMKSEILLNFDIIFSFSVNDQRKGCLWKTKKKQHQLNIDNFQFDFAIAVLFSV